MWQNYVSKQKYLHRDCYYLSMATTQSPHKNQPHFPLSVSSSPKSEYVDPTPLKSQKIYIYGVERIRPELRYLTLIMERTRAVDV